MGAWCTKIGSCCAEIGSCCAKHVCCCRGFCCSKCADCGKCICCCKCVCCCCQCKGASLPVDRSIPVGIQLNDPSELIKQIEQEPLVPLQEALRPFQKKIKDLPKKITTAQKLCTKPSKHGLTPDESAAIYIYSMGTDENSLYDHLKKAWQSKGPEQIRPWFSYLRLLFSAVKKCPDAPGEVWQGMEYNDRVEEILRDSSAALYIGFGSAIASPDPIRQRLNGKNDNSCRIIFVKYSDVQAKDISDYIKKGPEYILFPGIDVVIIVPPTESPDGSLTFYLSPKSKVQLLLSPIFKVFSCP